MKTRDTKTLLLEHGTRLLIERGYHATGIQDVLAATGVPKGSFYHHFRNKEDFGLQAIQRYADDAYRTLDKRLSDERRPPLERVRRFFADIFTDWDQRSCREGCLLGNIGQELADVNESFRQTVAASLEQWAQRIATCLSEAQRRGELDPDINVRELASQLIDGFEGAALRMKLVKNTSPLDGFLRLYFDRFLTA